MKIIPVFSTAFITKVSVCQVESWNLLIQVAAILRTAANYVPANIQCPAKVAAILKQIANVPAGIIDDSSWENGAEKAYPGFDVVLMVDTNATANSGGPVNILPSEFGFFSLLLMRMQKDDNERRFDLEIDDFRKCSAYHSSIMIAQVELSKVQTSMYKFSS